jgi:RNA recognition motif-containing protein
MAQMNAQESNAQSPVAEKGTKVYVGNLTYDVTSEQLHKEFEKFGAL